MSRISRIAVAAASVAALAGCAVPSQTTRLIGGPEPVTVRLEPAVPTAGQSAELTITSPGADSIVVASENGLDRYWSTRGVLRARLTSTFGDSVPTGRYATRWHGELLSRLKKPAVITVCRQGRCQKLYHEFPVQLPEANHRTVALTAGYDAVFARRSLVGSHSTVLFREVLSSGIWSAHAEWVDRGWNARLEGFAGRGERGASFDLSRVLKRAGEVSYGVALHVDADRSEWLPDGESPVLADRTGWRAGIGPSLMLRGITASSQLGVYSDGAQTLQVVSTRISINGNLTEVRLPVSLSAEKSFAFGGGAIVSRRRDAIERMVASVHVLDAFAVNLGLSTHRSAWPNEQPNSDFRATETLVTLGGRYTITW
ncbi:MAG TPA: hypothetical protein VMY76_15080 [Gemmatimonadales bacterium]|nr:hypothetical protein [Gemmatimonadales bacterium]